MKRYMLFVVTIALSCLMLSEGFAGGGKGGAGGGPRFDPHLIAKVKCDGKDLRECKANAPRCAWIGEYEYCDDNCAYAPDETNCGKLSRCSWDSRKNKCYRW